MSEKLKKLIIPSYSSYYLMYNYVTAAYGAYFFFFYETEVGMSTGLLTLATAIFSIFIIIANPIVAYLINRTYKWTPRWGRRFPYIVSGALVFILSNALIFLPPNGASQTVVVIRLIFFSVLYNLAISFMSIGHSALFVDKFRGDKTRANAQLATIIIGTIGVLMGTVIPPLLIQYGNINSYFNQGVVAAGIGLVALMITLPGIYEDDEMRARNVKVIAESNSLNFVQMYKLAMKQKNLVAWTLFGMGRSVGDMLVPASINYIILFILKKEASMASTVGIIFFFGTVLCTPLWSLLARKVNDNFKFIKFASIFLTIAMALMFFYNTLVGLIIGVVIYALAQGAYDIVNGPFNADVYDGIIAATGRRDETIYTGFSGFVTSFSRVIQAGVIFLTHTLFNFVEGSAVQTPTAIIGIKLQYSLAPALIMVISTIILWKWIDLKHSTVLENKQKIQELGL